MNGKKSFALRIDEKTWAALEKWAADEFRSVNGQIEYLLLQALREAHRAPKDYSDSPINCSNEISRKG